MDDRAPPRFLVESAERLKLAAEDYAEILRARTEEWLLPLSRIDKALGPLTDAVELARLAARATADDVDPEWRAGGWTITYTGRKFWPLDPRPGDVDPVDIAHALAHKGRFGGHGGLWYSVGAHTLRVAAMAQVLAAKEGQDIRLATAFALLDDSDEAYLPDVPAPIKPFIPGWLEMEARVRQAAYDRFGLGLPPYEIADIVQRCDLYARAIEMRALFDHLEDGPVKREMLDDTPYPTSTAVETAGEMNLGLSRPAVEAVLLEGLRQTMPDFYEPAAPAEMPFDEVVRTLAADLAAVLKLPVDRHALAVELRGWQVKLAAAKIEAAARHTPKPKKTAAAWLKEDALQTPAVDPRVERNKRRLLEGS